MWGLLSLLLLSVLLGLLLLHLLWGGLHLTQCLGKSGHLLLHLLRTLHLLRALRYGLILSLTLRLLDPA